jgi:uncharacterized membrane protein YdjX (TVP38/TMEM64 family)
VGPRARLILLTAVVTAVPVVLALTDVLSVAALRDAVREFGPLAPLAWVAISAALGAALFPGPLLAGASGVLFGPWVGTLTTVCSAVLSAMVSREVGQRAGYAGAVDLLGERAAAVQRHGTTVVLVQRLAPGVPDAPLSYLFGALGVSRRAVLLGTAVGTLPRAFSYTAIGASLDDPGSPLGWAGVIGAVLSAVLGAVAVRRSWVLRTR